MQKLVVKNTCGVDEPERCNQALTVAATAAASGADVTLWLTGEAAWLAVPGRAEQFELPHATAAIDLLAPLAQADAIRVCSQCAKRRGLTQDQLIVGASIAGSALFVEQILHTDVTSLVY